MQRAPIAGPDEPDGRQHPEVTRAAEGWHVGCGPAGSTTHTLTP